MPSSLHRRQPFRTSIQGKRYVARLGGIAEQGFDLRGSEIARIDANQRTIGRCIEADFINALAAPDQPLADSRERALDELAPRVLLASGKHEVVLLGVPHDVGRVAILARVWLKIGGARHPRTTNEAKIPGSPPFS
jgi:hypothetical protein